MAAGEMPNFSRLAEQGVFRRLGTSVPAMSPVAWSSFSTGVDASRHAIFDFLSRDPRSYAPILSSSSVTGPKRFLKLGPARIPLEKGNMRFLRRSKSFWRILSEYGVFCNVLRVPITFPPEKINGVMLSGMCVPDLRGTMGSFTYFTESEPDEKIGGLIIRLERNGESLKAELPGPPTPGTSEPIKLPLEIKVDRERGGATIKISGDEFFIKEREFSPWKRLTFKAGPGVKMNGIARFYITSMDGAFGLYVSPIHIDPEKPAMPVSYPNFYSIYLAKRQGLFGTLGLAEDTWAINERVLDEDGFIEQAYLFHRERERMFLDTLARLKKGLAVCVFDLSDRLQHIFFRYLVEDHAANRDKDTVKHKDALYEMYREMDRLLGKTLEHVDGETVLIVMSDHGFKPFKKGVDLNAWLRDHGYLHLKDDGEAEYLQNVDWSRTKAYAIGLGGIFLNLKGRERNGIVEPGEAQALKSEICTQLVELRDPSSGDKMVNRVFDVERDFTGPYRKDGPDLIVGFAEGIRVSWDCARGKVTERVVEENEKSWSGDHCMDPDVVPGIFFSNLKTGEENPGITDIAPSVLKLFGIDPPAYMTGKDLFES
jgi:predicted AlkP superfamily phosphohydrolase/phosphomutase